MVTGAVAHWPSSPRDRRQYLITVALHTDHCPKDKLDTYVRPLLAISAERVRAGKGSALFHRTCGTARPSPSPRTRRSPRTAQGRPPPRSSSRWRSAWSAARRTASRPRSTTAVHQPQDFEKTVEALGTGEHGRYLLAATFGNVHGVYKPGNVKLKPEVLAEGQRVAAAKLGLAEGACRSTSSSTAGPAAEVRRSRTR